MVVGQACLEAPMFRSTNNSRISGLIKHRDKARVDAKFTPQEKGSEPKLK